MAGKSSPFPSPPGQPPLSPRALPVYKAARDLSAYLWQFKTDRGLTDTETLMVLMDVETRLIRHLVLGDPYPVDQ